MLFFLLGYVATSSAQRIVAIHLYEGTTCDETAIHPDEDITLFREIFGHEFLGGGNYLPIARLILPLSS